MYCCKIFFYSVKIFFFLQVIISTIIIELNIDILQTTFQNLSQNVTFSFSSTSEGHSVKESNQPFVSIPKRGKRNCAVINCNTSEHRGLLKSWYSKKCLLHNVYNGTKLCNCQPPIALFPFPSKQKHPEDNLRWQ